MQNLHSDLLALSEDEARCRAILDGISSDAFEAWWFCSGDEGDLHLVQCRGMSNLSKSERIFLVWARGHLLLHELDVNVEKDAESYFIWACEQCDLFREFESFVKRDVKLHVCGSSDVEDRFLSFLQMVRFVAFSRMRSEWKTFLVHLDGQVLPKDELSKISMKLPNSGGLRLMDDWNDQCYSFETDEAFGYFRWLTSA
ncbi:hypothetical protein [Halocynthiibacter namhaensis]|uniref:hypothetical protein n=1 Tax=Halocynthiibacter namhaensis TaxID=1290553 RepID=UPI000579109B|nr:hypothetical protein [Halocynthiibacter namhaensis]